MDIPGAEVQTASVFSTRLEDLLNCDIDLGQLAAKGGLRVAQGIAAGVCGEKGPSFLPSPGLSQLATDSPKFLGSCGLVTIICVYLDILSAVNRESS